MAVAADHNVIPVTETFIADTETPVSAFLKLRGTGPAFLLESAEQGQRVGRYSFIGVEPRKVVRWSLADGGDPYAIAAAEVAEHRQAPLADGPPFTGGAVGFFGYDCVRAVEPLGEPNPDVLGLPDMALMLSDVLVAFDHLKHTVTILANAYRDEADGEARARERIAEVRERLAGPLPRPEPHAERPEPQFEPNMPREAFEAMVARIVEYVHAGDAFQVVPSQRWSAPTPGRVVLDLPRAARGQPVALHVLPRLRGLPDRRRLARAARHGLRPQRLDAPDRRHAPARGGRRRRHRDRRRPAGRREGARRARDARRPRPQRPRPRLRVRHRRGRDVHGRRDLLARDPHRLQRARRAAPRGRPRSTRCAPCCPAGTLSGAPKVRAMQIIDELEPVKRGAYGGAVGWLSYAGDLDTCICIRTVVVKDGVAHVQAGGGTVADAKPDYEYEESRAKARGVVRAIELAARQREWP